MKTPVMSPVNVEERETLDVRAGDTVRVWQKITEYKKEKDKVKETTRTQAFEGLVLARKHGREAGATFTVRRIASGVGVERIFPLYSPLIDKVEILRRAKTRRAKLYHIREKAAKEISHEMRKTIKLVRDETAAKIKAKEGAEAAKRAAAKAKSSGADVAEAIAETKAE